MLDIHTFISQNEYNFTITFWIQWAFSVECHWHSIITAQEAIDYPLEEDCLQHQKRHVILGRGSQ